jgi:hypothetical protein
MASILKVDKLDPQSGTALEIGTSGDTITVPSGATLDISASTLTPPATLPASSGVNLTALNASNLGSGTVPTARLGTGTASSSTVLYGDQTYKAEPTGGKILQVIEGSTTTSTNTTSTSYVDTTLTADITPSATSSKVLVLVAQNVQFINQTNNTSYIMCQVLRDTTVIQDPSTGWSVAAQAITSPNDWEIGATFAANILDSPSSTSALTYKVQGKSGYAGASITFQKNSHPSRIILMEVSA